eukprot:CAMPEP_0168593496 /NCGR_PEP_ID=MMETSP0420-20121227/8350_1 /TAXON_ID=498008 /ORGANISM="Pessonella sp." /LENGTH=360 /DNA_ID=CAMNT_0008629661 /DNA_START=47 /DNA_END=1126 /DNA_ORIENTATION=-
MSIVSRIEDIESEIARTQKNKATNAHLGLLKAKLAKLRRELIEGSKSSGGGPGEGFDVRKTGDIRVGLVGFPSVGKSTLLNKLTNTFSEVGAYEFTTLTCVPGTIYYKGAKIQLLDLPGIIEGAKDGKGRGRQVIAVAKTCDLICICLDALKPLTHKHLIEHELDGFGIRLNKRKPNISYKKKEKGGVNFTHTVPLTHVDSDTVKKICTEYKINSCDICFKEDATADELIDVIEGNRRYVPALYVLNKIDQLTIEELDILYQMEHCVPISAHQGWNLDVLLEKMWASMDLVRVYTKPKGQIPDYTSPVVLTKERCSVEDFCDQIHRNIKKSFKFANVWGSSAKHNPQRVGLSHILEDEDV